MAAEAFLAGGGGIIRLEREAQSFCKTHMRFFMCMCCTRCVELCELCIGEVFSLIDSVEAILSEKVVPDLWWCIVTYCDIRNSCRS